MSAKDGGPPLEQKGLSRRSFIKGLGTGTLAATTISTGAMSVSPKKIQAQPTPQISGPGVTPVTLIINGATYEISVEPRETLLEVLRNRLDITGPKLVCDRGSCGACTVYLNSLPVYACMTLAIEVQGVEVTTIEENSCIPFRKPLLRRMRYNAVFALPDLQCPWPLPWSEILPQPIRR